MKKINWLILLCWLSLWNTSLAQMLNSLPNNSDTIIETEPALVWQCMTSYIGNPRYSMVLTVTEMAEEQSAVEALLENTPILYRENLSQNSFTITSTEAILNENVWYAWQATLLYDGVPVQQSEAWKFIIYEPNLVIPTINLRRVNDNSIHRLENGIVYLSTDEIDITNLQATITEKSGKITKVNLEKVEMDNESELKSFSLDLNDYPINNGKILFKWSINKGVTFYLNFEI